MKLFYYKDPAGNFGDDLNPWLWPRIAPDLLDDDPASLFVGIGTILDERIPAEPIKVVFGTGVGYGRLPAIDERWHICCVRGPLTARALGFPSDVAITDSAALVSLVAPPQPPKLYPVSFIPHFRTDERANSQGINLEAVCNDLNINYINPHDNVEATISALQSSVFVIAEAMHGAIVADALRVPWVPVQLYDHIRSLKWWDWCASLDLEYNPMIYSASSPGVEPSSDLARFLKNVVVMARPVLSSNTAFSSVLERLQEHLYRLQTDRSATACFSGSPELVQDPEVLQSIPWFYDIQLAIEQIRRVIPQGASFILVDDMQWGEGHLLAGRHAIPFLDQGGHYWGLPPDSATAIQELERLRQTGATFIVFAWPSFWWLNHYSDFSRYLRSEYKPVLETDRLLIFDCR